MKLLKFFIDMKGGSQIIVVTKKVEDNWK